MRFSTTAISLIICIVIFSIFMANVANLINMDKHLTKRLNAAGSVNHIKWDETRKMLQLDNRAEHLMWFVQISDLHISQFKDPDRVPHLIEFCNKTIDVIRPSVVLASGDLTDAKTADMLGSKQYEKEWKMYSNALKKTNIVNKTVWLDIRGNHDNFNVPVLLSKTDYFTNYSVQGKNHARSYMHHMNIGDERYTFIGVDACLEPGPKRPFNFLGLLSLNETQHIIDLAEQSRALKTNYTIWFGHYPTSCILTPGLGTSGIRSVIGKYDEGYAYLCGHFHKLGGLIPNMYTLQQDGFLELELGDWMKNRMYRLAAFDHGLFSFVDVQHNEWPVVLITNPKNALFNIPGKEDPNLQRESTYIRLLAFSPSDITECSVKIDKGEWETCHRVSNELFVVPWDPFLYRKNLHKLSVFIRDKEGRTKVVDQEFTIDGSRLQFDILARVILMWDMNKIFQILFSLALLLNVLPLCFFRILHTLVRNGTVMKPKLRTFCFGKWIKKMWILSTIDRLMIPLVCYCLYLTFGPWSFGEVIDGHMAIVFVWGIFVNNAFLPGTLTYFYGFFQLVFCQYPLIIIFASNVSLRFYEKISGIKKKRTCLVSTFHNLPFIVIMIVEIILAYIFWTAYGTLAFIITPLRTWSVILNIVLWYQSKTVPDKCLRSAATVWSSEAKLSSQ